MWAQLGLAALAVYGTLMILSQCSFWLVRRHEVKRTIVFIVMTQHAENDIEGVLRRISHKCRNLDYPSRVYVIDVASTDLTVSIVKKFQATRMNLELRHATTIGEAHALATEIGEELPGAIRCLLQVQGNQVAPTVVLS